MPRAMPRQRLVVAQRDQRLEQRGDLAVDPVAEPALHLLGDLGLGVLVDERLNLRARARRRRPPACRPRARPTSARPARSRRSRCRGRCRTCRRASESAGASAATPAARRVRACSASADGSSRKRNPSSRPMNWSSILTSPFSVTVATRPSFCFSRRISTRCAGRRTAGSAARAARPTAGLLPHGSPRANGPRRPPRPPRCADVGPGADIGQPLADSASMSPSVRSMRAICRASQSVGMPPAVVQEAEEPGAEARVLGRRDLAEVGHLADVPEQPHVRRAPDALADLGALAERAQRREVVRLAGAGEVGAVRRRLEARDQRRDAGEVEPGVAPLQPARAARSGGSRSPRPPRGRAAAPRR